MRAEPAAAVGLCGELIDAGRATAAVHAQLVLSLDKSGRSAEARRALERGLGAWPDDRDLIDLRERLSASTSERERLEQAGRRNESALSQGRLRLLCLTKTGDEGLAACREYLTLTDKDGERVRARLAELEDALAPTLAATPSPDRTADDEPANAAEPDEPLAVTTPVEPRPEPSDEASSGAPDGVDASPPTPVAETVPVPAPTAVPVPAPDAARRALVTDVQRVLNALGLDAGIPDGIAGRRTREALARFGERTNAGGALALDERTLARLEAERTDRDAARELLARSRAAADAGAPEEALRELARAEERSALLFVPFGYRAGLEADRDEARRVAALAAVPTPSPTPSPAPSTDAVVRQPTAIAPASTPSVASLGRTATAAGSSASAGTAPSTDAIAATPAADTAAALMTLIGTLERRLADEATVRRGADTRLRDVVERTLSADVSD